MRHLILSLSSVILFFFASNISAQDSCDQNSIDEMLFQKRVKMALEDMATKLMKDVCPNSGREPYFQILDCKRAVPCVTTSKVKYPSCVFLEARLGFRGWTCYSIQTDSVFELDAIVLFHDDTIVDVPEDYVKLNDAFEKAKVCNELVGIVLKKVFEEYSGRP